MAPSADSLPAPRPFRATLAWIGLLLALPLALLGSLTPANRYQAMGLDALDCDGPLEVYLLALPALAIYGAALTYHARRWRRPLNAAAAALCLLLCGGLGANLVSAVRFDLAQHGECAG
jgi:hypothetical protein